MAGGRDWGLWARWERLFGKMMGGKIMFRRGNALSNLGETLETLPDMEAGEGLSRSCRSATFGLKMCLGVRYPVVLGRCAPFTTGFLPSSLRLDLSTCATRSAEADAV